MWEVMLSDYTDKGETVRGTVCKVLHANLSIVENCSEITVRHFLLECCDFAQVKNNCFHVDNMK